VLPLVTSHAALLGRTLLYTAVTRARRLAVRGWRQTPRHTALGGLLAGTLRFTWPRAAQDGTAPHPEEDAGFWEGLLQGAGTEASAETFR
jgi:hypothetical protein